MKPAYLVKNLAIVTVFSFILISGCTEVTQPVQNNSSGFVNITDGFGREVTVPSEINSVICTGSSGVRYIVYLDAADLLAGVSSGEQTNDTSSHETRPYKIANPQFADLPTIGSSKTGENLEQIMTLNPQVLFMAGYTSTSLNDSPGTVSDADIMQKKTNIPVISAPTGSLLTEEGREQMYSTFRLMGDVFNRTERAGELVDYIKLSISDLEERTKNITDSEQKTAYIGGLSHSGPHGITSSQPNYPPFEWVHVKNIAGDYDLNYVEYSKESLLYTDPDYIFIDAGTLNLMDETGAFQDIRSNTFSDMKAVKNGDVYSVLPYNHAGNNLETVLADAYYIGKVVYPGRFSDIDPVKKADEIYMMFEGKPVFDKLNANCNGLGLKKVNLT
ncbi:iron complex transport system substrate-binding protein [Methanomicrobium sp. W14]|uniref:iron ABC transporter substrate-binding protein n=1 Tax=Methanomicrobium sp. W14 TaxID=2817839 RepID=UPI001AEB1C02|nr:iron ABC transporter substrate-binding protein [Methanomicrobium sp. W14]MBP2134398.1 iron complex transport system substrate-binding protein [Methanomicrobium sp. W14]